MKELFPKKGILIAFGELFLKSERVRKIFQRRLVQSLFSLLKKKNFDFKIHSFRERIFVALPVDSAFVAGSTSAKEAASSESEKRRRETKEINEVSAIIKNLPGIVWFSEALFFEKLNPVKSAQSGTPLSGVFDGVNLKGFSDFLAKNYQKWIKKGKTFALRLKREKEIKNSSEEIIKETAKRIERKVDLSKPQREIFIEARRFGWFLYFKKRRGIGGLPLGTGGKVLSLISGGIDSPVAVFLMAKRGAENIWLHFHSFPLVSRTSIEKVKELARIFLNYTPHLKIYFLPFSKIQMEIKSITFPKYRVLLYRRLMLKIAEKIAQKENCQALVTGESLGQVSSQTLPNIKIIESGIKIPILRPLIGFDKEEIINLAKKIRTFSISIKPQEDCCTLFIPKHASAEGNSKEIKKIEKKIISAKGGSALGGKKEIEKIIEEAEIEKY